MKYFLLFIVFAVLLLNGCGNSQPAKTKEVIIFHAGSLSVPFRQLKEEYEKGNPDVKILLESAGSLVCARKITELKKPCDIIASADYLVIDELLIPDYTNWGIRFATNEIVIAYNDKSRYSKEITDNNWIDILLKDDVIYSRSDPDSDPGGYRAVLTLMLAEKYYNKEGLTGEFISRNKDYVRPKEVDLIALIESNSIDYIFIYKSVAVQHDLRYVELPSEINLSDPSKQELYNSVCLDVTGSKPDTKIRVYGDYINYSLSVLDNAPQKTEAIEFIGYLLSEEGQEILRKNGQEPLSPFYTEQYDSIPSKLQHYFSEYEVI